MYSSKSHWGVLIEELSEVFETKQCAEAYAKPIRKYNPEYRIEIYKLD